MESYMNLLVNEWIHWYFDAFRGTWTSIWLPTWIHQYLDGDIVTSMDVYLPGWIYRYLNRYISTWMDSPTLTKAIPLQAWRGPEGSKSLRLPYLKTNGIFSALRTDRLYQQETFLALISVRDCVIRRAIVRQERLCQRIIKRTKSGIEPATPSAL